MQVRELREGFRGAGAGAPPFSLRIGDRPGDGTDLDGRSRGRLVSDDPPYNVAYVGKTQDALTIENDKMDDAQFRVFLCNAFTAAFGSLKPGGVFYVFHGESEG